MSIVIRITLPAYDTRGPLNLAIPVTHSDIATLCADLRDLIEAGCNRAGYELTDERRMGARIQSISDTGDTG